MYGYFTVMNDVTSKGVIRIFKKLHSVTDTVEKTKFLKNVCNGLHTAESESKRRSLVALKGTHSSWAGLGIRSYDNRSFPHLLRLLRSLISNEQL